MESVISVEEIAYAAGLFDGEGCVSIYKIGNRRLNCALYLRAQIVMTDPRPLQWMKQRFGGSLTQRKRQKHYKVSFDWRLFSENALQFLELVRPFLIVKKDQAELAIEFQKISRRNKRKKNNPDNEVKLDLYGKVRDLKLVSYAAA